MDVFFKKYFPMLCELFYIKLRVLLCLKRFFRGGCLTPRRFSFFFIIIFNLFLYGHFTFSSDAIYRFVVRLLIWYAEKPVFHPTYIQV